MTRGLHFNSADHALDAASEGAGVLLARDVLAYDDLRMGRLVVPIEFALRPGRAYYFICPKSREARSSATTGRRGAPPMPVTSASTS